MKRIKVLAFVFLFAALGFLCLLFFKTGFFKTALNLEGIGALSFFFICGFWSCVILLNIFVLAGKVLLVLRQICKEK